MSAARAAGHCRPWKYSIDLLEIAYRMHKNDVASVVHTIMTNLKYNDMYKVLTPTYSPLFTHLLTYLFPG